MNTSHGLGRSLIRRMRAATSSPSERGTRSLADRLADYTTWPEPPLRSRCVVHTSSGSVGTHGATIGRLQAVYVVRGDVLPDMTRALVIGENGQTAVNEDGTTATQVWRDSRLWDEWGWTE